MCLLALRILDQQTALRALHEDDKHNQSDDHRCNGDDKHDVHRGRASLADQVNDGLGQLRHDTGENDE